MYRAVVAAVDASGAGARDPGPMRSRTAVLCGLALFAAAPAALLLTGHTEIKTSADTEADTIPLAAAVLPLLVGLLLIRLVPPRLPALPRHALAGDPALARQSAALVGLAILFPVLVLLIDRSVWYGPAKVALLLGGAWLVLRRWPAPPPGAAEHRRSLPRWAYRLAPLPAILAWTYLLYYSPLAGDVDLSGYEDWDRAVLAAAMLFTFLTASVTEEIFYRVLLQTRLEARYGRWPAIVVTSLLFAAMHVHLLRAGLWPGLAVMLAWNGGFGLFVGYLWSRYRNVWALIVVHAAVNSLALLPLFTFGLLR